MESPCGLWCWATVQSVVLPGWRELMRHRAGGSVSGATNSSTSGAAFGGTGVERSKKENPGYCRGLREGMSLFRLVTLHLVFLHFLFLFFLVIFVVTLCFGVFFFVHGLVHFVHRFAGRLVLGKRERRH